MSTSPQDSPRSDDTNNEQHSSSTSKRSNYPPHNKLGKNGSKCPPRDNERTNQLLRDYANNGISDKKEISRLLLKGYGIYMSEATVAKRRRTLGLVKRPAPTKGISDREKELLILKHMWYPGWEDPVEDRRGRPHGKRRPPKLIQKIIKDEEKTHITGKDILSVLKAIEEGKTGPNAEWCIEIYQPLRKLGLCIVVFRDIWTGGWRDWTIINGECAKEAFSRKIFCWICWCLVNGEMPHQISIKSDTGEPQDHELFNILRQFLSDSISEGEAVVEISAISSYPVIRGWPNEIADYNCLDEVRKCFENGVPEVYNITDVRHGWLASTLWEQVSLPYRSVFSSYKCLELDLDYHAFQIYLNHDQVEKLNKLLDFFDDKKSARWIRFKITWNYLHPRGPSWYVINFSSVWDYFEKMLPLWERQFIITNDEWSLKEYFDAPSPELLPTRPLAPEAPLGTLGPVHGSDITSGICVAPAPVHSTDSRHGYNTTPYPTLPLIGGGDMGYANSDAYYYNTL